MDISLSFDFQSNLARQVISPTVVIAYIVERLEFEFRSVGFQNPHSFWDTPWPPSHWLGLYDGPGPLQATSHFRLRKTVKIIFQTSMFHLYIISQFSFSKVLSCYPDASL